MKELITPRYRSVDVQLGYQHFEELIGQLRTEGYAKSADKLDFMLHRVAWTTGSELIGEFGLEILSFQKQADSISPDLLHCIDASMSFVRSVWPDIK